VNGTVVKYYCRELPAYVVEARFWPEYGQYIITAQNGLMAHIPKAEFEENWAPVEVT
jgi:hypothetical protein